MKFSIKIKLLAGFTLILLLVMAISLYMTRQLADTNESLTNIVDVSSRKVMLSNEILIGVLETARHEKNIILEGDSPRRDTYREMMRSASLKVDRLLPELEELVDNTGDNYLQDFKKIWADYKLSVEDIVTLAYANKDAEAFKISSEEGYVARNQSIQLLTQLVEKNKAAMLHDKEISEAAYKSSVNMMMLLVGVGIALAIVLAYWIITSIARRINKITDEAEKIASREYTTSQLTQNEENDELKPVFDSLVSINNSFREVTQHAARVAEGNYNDNITPKSDKDILGNALKKMTTSLKTTTEENQKHNWLTSGLNQLSEKLRGDKEVEVLAADTLAFLCEYTHSQVGALYLADNNLLNFTAGHAYALPAGQQKPIAFKEGQVGEAAHTMEPVYLTGVEAGTLSINSSFVEVKPTHIMIVPFLFEGKTMGVIEIGSLEPFTETEKEFVNTTLESIAISINSALSRRQIQMLLEETQVQSEELQSQQEELRQMNEELEEQTQSLKQQQEEMQITNEELEEQTQALEWKNRELEGARMAIEEKNSQIEASSKYKSEFLANMSHELRTPLNSLLILSKDLADNKGRNLTDDQVESAEIIYNSGHDLLNLINEVLDLSKIEAGKMHVHVERVNMREFIDTTQKNFRRQAEQKKLNLKVEMDQDVPEFIFTDRQRLDQIIKNLMSNALKFTEKGGVTVNIKKRDENTVSIAIKDTGIGIPQEKQNSIFEAFQQADGGTSRKYGGTGLGLSISRELIKLLGAQLSLESEVGKGSLFTLTIPVEYKEQDNSSAGNEEPAEVLTLHAQALKETVAIPDDREAVNNDDKLVLIIEDDLKFASILMKQAHQKGFKAITAATGEAGLLLADKYKPHAIIMDMTLPGMKGDQVLAHLKSNQNLRHIPVHIISGQDRSLDMIKSGAIEYLTKPVERKHLEEAFNRIENFINRKMKNLLIVVADDDSRDGMCRLIANGDVNCIEARNGEEALLLYKDHHIDCIILDIDLPDMTGTMLINQLEKIKDHMAPIVVYTDRVLTREENDELQKSTETIIIKGTKSEERLLDETSLFLHRAIGEMPESNKKVMASLHDKDALFKGKKILLTDDDMRNVFALSKILKERGIEILKAENGQSALNVLDKNPQVDLVLMDIMMPEMDGYEAMKQIRLQSKFKNLPIIALTAKAMKEDRQKCIDAGANDYITKPVDVERLLSLIRVWLSK
jgi:signal transduction histidine kinase/DNA-binding response OmpR family regulator